MVPERPRVSAAVLRDEGREVLMVKHRRPDRTEYWQLPGGGLLPDESPEAGVLRELLEETSLAGQVVRFCSRSPTSMEPQPRFWSRSTPWRKPRSAGTQKRSRAITENL